MSYYDQNDKGKILIDGLKFAIIILILLTIISFIHYGTR